MSVSCNTDDLIQAAACFRCIPLSAVKTFLLCQWASGSAPSGLCVTLSGAGTAGVNQTYTPVSATEYDGVGYGIYQDPTGFWVIINTSLHVIYYLGPLGGSPLGPYNAGDGLEPGPTGVFVTCPTTPTTSIILPDGSGGFWLLVVDNSGNVGTQSDPGPASTPIVLDDGGGGFWQIVVDNAGNRGTNPVAGPATFPVPTLTDGLGDVWTLVVDTNGNLGASM